MFNLEAFQHTFHGITPLRLRNVSRLIGWDNGMPPGGGVEPRHAMFLWLADFLQTFDTMSHDYVDSILATFRKQIIDYGKALDEALTSNKTEIPVAVLTVADRRYATVTGSDVFLDLNSGNTVEGLKRAAACANTFNLAEIYTRQLDRMKRVKKA